MNSTELLGHPYRTPDPDLCEHGITFDEDEAKSSKHTSNEIRQRWPRLFGECSLGCGYHGIYYASLAHFIYGDW